MRVTNSIPLGHPPASYRYHCKFRPNAEGLSWTVSGDAYTLAVNTSKGLLSYGRRERPQFLKPNSMRGEPTHMFNGVQDQQTGFTHTIAVPLAGHTTK